MEEAEAVKDGGGGGEGVFYVVKHDGNVLKTSYIKWLDVSGLQNIRFLSFAVPGMRSLRCC